MFKTITECIEYMYNNLLIDGVNYDCLMNQLNNLHNLAKWEYWICQIGIMFS